MKTTVSGVLEDLKLKQKGSDQNLSCPESALLAVSAKLNPESPNVHIVNIYFVAMQLYIDL